MRVNGRKPGGRARLFDGLDLLLLGVLSELALVFRLPSHEGCVVAEDRAGAGEIGFGRRVDPLINCEREPSRHLQLV